ncbi:MAG: rhodanese-like domain-containing protein [Rhodobacterales bacterium]|nr:rhodanese-like domain-containing protein [Rhodobacterales bacterium]
MSDTPASYAGDLMPTDAWALLVAEGDAVLIDVRTDAEWTYVGIPDLSALGRQPLFVPWQFFPGMAINADFARQVAGAGVGRDVAVLMLCRSGVRSKAAARSLTAAGWSRAYNVAHGFEGDRDGERHRGRVNGWKADGLPWVQG